MNKENDNLLYASWEEGNSLTFTALSPWGVNYRKTYYCSNCGYQTIFNNEELCPNCNAVMVNYGG